MLLRFNRTAGLHQFYKAAFGLAKPSNDQGSVISAKLTIALQKARKRTRYHHLRVHRLGGWKLIIPLTSIHKLFQLDIIGNHHADQRHAVLGRSNG
jgi:hypothetical protein